MAAAVLQFAEGASLQSTARNVAWKADNGRGVPDGGASLCDSSLFEDAPFSGMALNLHPGAGVKPSRVWAEPSVSRVSRDGAPSLDSVTNNRHKEPEYYVRPHGRGKHCGRFSIRGKDPATGRIVARRVNCGGWNCSYCGPRRARLAKKRISCEAEKLGLSYFWTLTLPVGAAPDPLRAVRVIRTAFNHLREYLKRQFGHTLRYICVLEFTEKGIPHLHVLFDRYIDHGWMSRSWASLGAGYVVWVKRVTVAKVARYLSKYLTKDLLMSAPKGTRRITTSRDIHLFPKLIGPKLPWEFLRESVWALMEAYSGAHFLLQQDMFRFVGYTLDDEGFLQSFQVVSDA